MPQSNFYRFQKLWPLRKLYPGGRAVQTMRHEVESIQSSWLNTGPPGAILDYTPVERLGEAAGMYVAIVRVTGTAEKSSLSMIVGPCTEEYAYEIATLPDSKEGIAIARTIALIVLRSVFLADQWRSGDFPRLDTE